MSLASSLSRYVFHPLWDLKEGSRRLRTLRELERSQWLPVEVLRARQRERLERILAYAATHSPYYRRLFQQHGFEPDNFQVPAFRALPLLTKSIIRASTDEILSTEFKRARAWHAQDRGLDGRCAARHTSTATGLRPAPRTPCDQTNGPAVTTA